MSEDMVIGVVLTVSVMVTAGICGKLGGMAVVTLLEWLEGRDAKRRREEKLARMAERAAFVERHKS